MTKRCPSDDSEVFEDHETMCMEHVRELVSVVDDEPSGRDGDKVPRREQWSTEVCWRCGTFSPHRDNRTCLAPDCGRSLTPPALHIRFQDGEVDVEPGESVELGRHGVHGRVFRGFPNVSRRHAVVGVDDDRRAWVKPLPDVTNGTFVNKIEVFVPDDKTLVSGDTVRLARDAEGTVTLYDR
ncbi:FHA domain-containing protein [Actinocrispum wychmicini]|uniref:FHA domain-containing protein n=1 Tax=Actinocrispum wychmicini TaxID=1213861 RepID=A0A4V6NNR4_9PSEU|nr:FHA domain-containing protein [Actinocrispum wychmicini]TCO52920.1 FHA domain-containing protein [Actinocrispum wychmicini]